VRVPLRAPTAQGLASDEEAKELNALEDALLVACGEEVVFVGRETCEGRRTLHLHAAGEGAAVARLEAWSLAVPGRRVEVRVERDPSWSVLQRW
jgi:hypothetical protein